MENKKKVKFLALLLATVVSLSSYGSANNSKKESETEMFKHITILFNQKEYVLEIKGYKTLTGDLMEFILADNTSLYTSKKNAMLYSSTADIVRQFNTNHEVYDIETVMPNNNSHGADAVLLSANGETFSVGLESHKNWSGSLVQLNLSDSSIFCTDAKDVIIYDNNSKMMDQVEEKGQVKILEP